VTTARGSASRAPSTTEGGQLLLLRPEDARRAERSADDEVPPVGGVYDPDRAPSLPKKERDAAAEAELRRAFEELNKPEPLADAPAPAVLEAGADGSLVAAGAEAAAAYVAPVSVPKVRDHRTLERAKIVVGALDPSRRAVTVQIERPAPKPAVEQIESALPTRNPSVVALALGVLAAVAVLVGMLAWFQRAPAAAVPSTSSEAPAHAKLSAEAPSTHAPSMSVSVAPDQPAAPPAPAPEVSAEAAAPPPSHAPRPRPGLSSTAKPSGPPRFVE
jgi:hypothetical protein